MSKICVYLHSLSQNLASMWTSLNKYALRNKYLIFASLFKGEVVSGRCSWPNLWHVIRLFIRSEGLIYWGVSVWSHQLRVRQSNHSDSLVSSVLMWYSNAGSCMSCCCYFLRCIDDALRDRWCFGSFWEPRQCSILWGGRLLIVANQSFSPRCGAARFYRSECSF